ncbi:MAG TPA: M56 family metallopeptidase [Candidatus Elarobacter sp.]|jgi:beta-lactamase regulating signal transducer with metallopeptidase domain
MNAALSHAALAIAAAFFDSLWHGTLIAGSVWLGLRCMPKLGAATRYAIWLCALAAVVIVPVLTVGRSEQPSQPASDAGTAVAQHSASVVPVAVAAPPRNGTAEAALLPAAAREPARAAARTSRITIPPSLAAAVALMWVLVACARGLMLVLDVCRLRAIRRHARPWSDAYAYPVLVSDRVPVPIAAGFVRAAVILPAALVERLPDEAVNTIVIHEVAHLQRYDVWTNAVARIAEAFVALNPAAWFVMRRLVLEREIACDDWVVAHTGAGEPFARALATLASSMSARTPITAPSAVGSRHAIVVRIERLLDAHPRRLRLSPPALGGALMLLAAIALMVQSVSPVLAYATQPDVLAQASTPAASAAGCAVPNRGIVMTYFLGPKRRAAGLPADDAELRDARDVVARLGASHVATFDLTVDAAGKPRKVIVLSPPRYPGMSESIENIYMASTYKPALRNCVPVAATIRTAVPVSGPEPSVGSVIVPVYPVGWSARYPAACKVPTVTRVRFRPGFVPPTPYTAMLPAFPAAMNDLAVGTTVKTSVRVHVDAAGLATEAGVIASSGRQPFDDAVVTAARRATYPLSARTCRPLPSEYVWHTTFDRSTLLYRLGKTALMVPR